MVKLGQYNKNFMRYDKVKVSKRIQDRERRSKG